MKKIKKNCVDLLKNKEIQKEMKQIFRPIIELIIENISIYLFVFIFFILVGFLLHLGILIILIRYIKSNKN